MERWWTPRSIGFRPAISRGTPTKSNEGEVKIETSARIDEVIAQKKQYNKRLKTVKGYKIQLFYGNEKESYKIRDEFKKLSEPFTELKKDFDLEKEKEINKLPIVIIGIGFIFIGSVISTIGMEVINMF